MKVAITGANGFVGAALCKYFHQAGHKIVAFGNQETPHPNLLKIAEYIKVDITQTIPDIEADICIHTAALSSDTDSYKSLIISNVEGTLNVVEAAKKCSHLIHISSSSVYEFKNKPISEDDASIHAHLSDYGETKLLAEEIMELNIPSHQKRLILRPRAIYGIGDHILLPRLLKLICGNFFLCPFKKHIQSSLTHIDNVAYAIELFLIQANSAPLQVFNITDDKPYFMRELALKISSAVERHKLKLIPLNKLVLDIFLFLNSNIHIVKNISPLVLNSLNRNAILDISRIRKELNYRPSKNFQNSCVEIADWISKLGGKKSYLKQLPDAPWSNPL